MLLPPLTELIEESEVGAVEETDIIHAVAHHDQSVQTDVDIEAGIFVRYLDIPR